MAGKAVGVTPLGTPVRPPDAVLVAVYLRRQRSEDSLTMTVGSTYIVALHIRASYRFISITKRIVPKRLSGIFVDLFSISLRLGITYDYSGVFTSD